MKIGKIATILLLVLSSFGASSVAPSKAELESMYDKAFREFDANNYPQALKELDAIDARQPDLAESQNLRGVILMRQGDYDRAEAALQKALGVDPKFWNARFNLAEIPFLRKNWTEARNRFEGLLNGNPSELQGEATQLIQYKILLTYLLEGKENMVDSIMAKFELSPESAAVQYANAALAFHRQDEKEAKDLLARAEKSFSPQLNKLFAESLYEVGWLEKPAGQTRAALELTSAADRAAKAKAYAKAKFEQAQQAFQQRDFTAASKLVEEAETADANQAATANMRGAILLEQKDYDGADAAFRKAMKIDPKFREAQYNLALIPFKKKDYAQARDRFEALFSSIPGGDKDEAAQLVRYKIFLTYLLEGKDSRAEKMKEQFQFTSDTPALYYAQAAWEFKHDNPAKANDWVTSARKIYSPALNLVFADPFYDVGWIQNPAATSANAALAENTQAPAPAEATPGIEPSVIPGATVASNASTKDEGKDAGPQPAASVAAVAGMEAMASTGGDQPASAARPGQGRVAGAAPAAALSSPSVETPVASTASPAAAKPVPSGPSREAANIAPVAAASATPATVLAPATVREWSQPSLTERVDHVLNLHTILVGLLLLAGLGLLAWVIIPELRRRFAGASILQPVLTAAGPSLRQKQMPLTEQHASRPNRLAGGPPQVSLRLKASEPSLRRAAVPVGKPRNGISSPPPTGVAETEVAAHDQEETDEQPFLKPERFIDGVGEPYFHEHGTTGHTSPVSSSTELTHSDFAPSPFTTSTGGFTPAVSPEAFVSEPVAEMSPPLPDPFSATISDDGESMFESRAVEEHHFAEMSVPTEDPVTESAGERESEETDVLGREEEPIGQGQPIPDLMPAAAAELQLGEINSQEPEVSAAPSADEGDPHEAPVSQAAVEDEPAPEVDDDGDDLLVDDAFAPEAEPIGQGQPVPDLVPAVATELSAEEITPQESGVSPAHGDEELAEMPVSEALTNNELPSEIEAEEVPTAEAAIQPDHASSPEEEPVGQGQPIPELMPASPTELSPLEPETEPEVLSAEWEALPPVISAPAPAPEIEEFMPAAAMAALGALRQPASQSFSSEVITPEPAASLTTPAIMSQPTPTTPTAPLIRTAPAPTGGMPQPVMPQSGGAMHTAVHLTFSFEIASLHLTPAFKMSALQLKPTSKIVTMRLAPSQQPQAQAAMNLQVTFELATVQVSGSSIGMIRLTPSQQQRPGVISSPAFNIAGLQLVSGAGSEAAPVQLTASHQDQASVLVTGAFQIATVEFSPSFDIASIVLNSTSKNVSVQLPGTGPSAIEGAPVFEIGNVQLGGNGEIGIMQLSPLGGGPKRA